MEPHQRCGLSTAAWNNRFFLTLDVPVVLLIVSSHQGRQPEPRSFGGSEQFPRFNPSRIVHLTMARRSLYSLLIGLVSVLNGTALLLGPGLHALPGFRHHEVANRAARVDDRLCVSSGNENGSTCPICEYLAKGKVVTETVHFVRPNTSTPSIPALPSVSPDLRPQRACCSRAPPAGHTV
jgi:hypothetical protein